MPKINGIEYKDVKWDSDDDDDWEQIPQKKGTPPKEPEIKADLNVLSTALQTALSRATPAEIAALLAAVDKKESPPPPTPAPPPPKKAKRRQNVSL